MFNAAVVRNPPHAVLLPMDQNIYTRTRGTRGGGEKNSSKRDSIFYFIIYNFFFLRPTIYFDTHIDIIEYILDLTI